MVAAGVTGAGEVVRRHRQRVRLSQGALAARAGLSIHTIHSIERGRRGMGPLVERRLGTLLGTPFLRDVRRHGEAP